MTGPLRTSRSANSDTPTHIIDEPGAKVTRCGRKKPNDLPHVLAEFVQAHIDGHDMVVCEKCAEGGWPERAAT